MDLPRSRLKTALALSAVIGLHAALLWLLIARMGVVRIPVMPQSLELLWLAPAAKPADLPTAPAAEPQSNASQRVRRKAIKPSEAPPGVPEAIAAPPAEDGNAIHPPIDWAAELARSARDAAAAEAEKHYRAFDFPAAPAASPERAGIAWARPRFETQGGAMAVHLNNNCVLVFFPMPFVGCSIGHKPPNGDLFKSLKDGGSP